MRKVGIATSRIGTVVIRIGTVVMWDHVELSAERHVLQSRRAKCS
jgi:hypothetical protein